MLNSWDKKLLFMTKAILVFMVVVYLAIAFFTHPIGDDYGMAHVVKKMGFWPAQKDWYVNWSGRFTGVAVTSFWVMITDLSPYLYWPVPWFMILGTFLSFSFLLVTLGSSWFPKKMLIWGGLALTLICMSRMPLISEGYYWLMGSTCYTLGNILVVTIIALIVRMHHTPSHGRRLLYTVLAGFLVIPATGTNEVLMMLMVIGTAPFVLLHFVTKNSKRYYLLAIFVVILIGAALVIFTPGNAVRTKNFYGHHRLLFSLSSSFSYAFLFFKYWVTDAVVLTSTLLLLTFIPQISRHVVIPPERKKLWMLFPLYWLILFVIAFFPTYWAMGLNPPMRTINLIHLLFLMGWYGSVIVITLLLPPKDEPMTIVPRPLRMAANIIFVFALLVFPNFSTALTDLLFKAYPYHQEVIQRVEDTRKSVEANREYVIIHPLRHRPSTLFSKNFEFRDDPNHWVNYDWERFWNIKVILEKPE